jgi:anti-anti-sigma regulatory factor
MVFAVGGHITLGDIPQLCSALHASLEGGDVELVICDVGGLVHPDAVAVDALARLQLTTRRHGCRMRLRDPSPKLLELIAFVGLCPSSR